LVEKL